MVKVEDSTLTKKLKERIVSRRIDKLAERQVREEESAARKVVLTRADSIRPEQTLWFWEETPPPRFHRHFGDQPIGRIPLGELTLIAGRENEGKSTLGYELLARVTRGQLHGHFFGEPRAVIIVATEDSWPKTVVPRLMAAGADLGLVYKATVHVEEIGEFTLSLPDDIKQIQAKVEETRAVAMLLDPLMSRLSSRLDSHKDQTVRQGLEPIAKLSQDSSVTTIGVIHVNKSNASDPLTTVMGSRAFVATSRAVQYVVRDPNNPKQRLLGVPKNNTGLSGDDSPTMLFTIEGTEVNGTGFALRTSRVVWQGVSEISINDVVYDVATNNAGKTNDAVEWLRSFMEKTKSGWAWSSDIKDAAKKAHHSERLVERARKALGLSRMSTGFPPRAIWARPGVEVQTELGPEPTEEL